MINNTAFICYSHSEYSDVWRMFFEQLDKYLPGVPKYLLTNERPRVEFNGNVLLYDDAWSYPRRVAACLPMVKEEVCIFHHDFKFKHFIP